MPTGEKVGIATHNKYKKRHDKVAGIVHWSVCEKYGLPRSEQWYRHTAAPVTDMEEVKILWDVNIKTGHVTEDIRPDIVVAEKDNNTTLLIAVPGDKPVDVKEQEKVDN